MAPNPPESDRKKEKLILEDSEVEELTKRTTAPGENSAMTKEDARRCVQTMELV
jgi:hypothetical protein